MRAWSTSTSAAAFAASVPLLTRLPPSALMRVIERVARPRGRHGSPDAEVAVERGIALASRMVRPTCLVRAITRYVFLRRAGRHAELAFGVGRPDGDYAGHSWVEVDGMPYRESRDPRAEFVEMLRLPTGSRP